MEFQNCFDCENNVMDAEKMNMAEIGFALLYDFPL